MMCQRKEGTPPEMFECAKCGKPFKLQPHGIGLPVHRPCEGPMGIGDIVAAGLKVTGITAAVQFVIGTCRGCDRRRNRLNELGKKIGL